MILFKKKKILLKPHFIHSCRKKIYIYSLEHNVEYIAVNIFFVFCNGMLKKCDVHSATETSVIVRIVQTAVKANLTSVAESVWAIIRRPVDRRNIDYKSIGSFY